MKRVVCSVLLLCLTSQMLRADIILTKRGRKYNGKVIRITEKAFVVRTVEGTVIGVPKADIIKIFRDNQVLDFEQGVRFYLEVRRPFLPFIVLSIATGAYGIKKYQDYKDHKEQADAELLKDAGLNEDADNVLRVMKLPTTSLHSDKVTSVRLIE